MHYVLKCSAVMLFYRFLWFFDSEKDFLAWLMGFLSTVTVWDGLSFPWTCLQLIHILRSFKLMLAIYFLKFCVYGKMMRFIKHISSSSNNSTIISNSIQICLAWQPGLSLQEHLNSSRSMRSTQQTTVSLLD